MLILVLVVVIYFVPLLDLRMCHTQLNIRGQQRAPKHEHSTDGDKSQESQSAPPPVHTAQPSPVLHQNDTHVRQTDCLAQRRTSELRPVNPQEECSPHPTPPSSLHHAHDSWALHNPFAKSNVICMVSHRLSIARMAVITHPRLSRVKPSTIDNESIHAPLPVLARVALHLFPYIPKGASPMPLA